MTNNRVWCGIVVAMISVSSACATTTQFEKNLKARRWSDAALDFETDTSLHTNERALYRAALLHSFPNKETYNPTLARTLFQRLLRLYPSSSRHQASLDHIAMLDEMQKIRQDSSRREWEIQREMTRRISDTQLLLNRLDSLTQRLQTSEQQTDQLRKQVARLEADIKERDDQLRTLRAELLKLKEIDLNPSRRPGVIDTTTRR